MKLDIKRIYLHLGLKFLKLGLQDVLYFAESEEIYTPNTNKLAKMGENPTVDPNVNGGAEMNLNLIKEFQINSGPNQENGNPQIQVKAN